MKTVHRISLPDSGRSMWYDLDKRFSPLNETLARIPMPWESDRAQLEGTWLSSVDDPALLDLWFPEELMNELKAMGFVQYKYLVKHWVELPNEIVFDIDTAIRLD